MTRKMAWEVVKWAWDFPLRTAILLGVGTFLMTRMFSLAFLAGVLGYFHQSAMEVERERRSGRP